MRRITQVEKSVSLSDRLDGEYVVYSILVEDYGRIDDTEESTLKSLYEKIGTFLNAKGGKE